MDGAKCIALAAFADNFFGKEEELLGAASLLSACNKRFP